MKSQFNKKSFIEASHKGILNGVNGYTHLMNRIPRSIPEYVFTISLANGLKEFFPYNSICLEQKPIDVIHEAGASGRGRYSDFMRKDGRIDIVIYNSEDNPLIPVEVKKVHVDLNQSLMQKLEGDIFRISDLVEKNSDVSSIVFGVVVFYVSVFLEEGGNERLEKISDRFNEKFREFEDEFLKISELSFSRIYTNEFLSWRSGVIIIADK